jgi:hypothetical protein
MGGSMLNIYRADLVGSSLFIAATMHASRALSDFSRPHLFNVSIFLDENQFLHDR